MDELPPQERIRVSVVIPTYNRAHVLPEVMGQVFAQDFASFDVWMIDDGSDDDTHEVIRPYLSDRVHYIYQDNQGVSAARNTGVRVSSGDFVAFLDSDDLWLPDKLTRQVAFLDRHPDVHVVCCDFMHFGDEVLSAFAPTLPCFSAQLQAYSEGDASLLPAHEIYACYLAEHPLRPSTLMVRRQTLIHCPFNEQIRISEDREFFLRLARTEAFGFLHTPLVQLRIWKDGKHLSDRVHGHQVVLGVLKTEGKTQQLSPRHRAALRQGLGQRCYLLGSHLFQQGYRLRAACTFLHGFVLSRKPRLLGHAAAALLPNSLYQTCRSARLHLGLSQRFWGFGRQS